MLKATHLIHFENGADISGRLSFDVRPGHVVIRVAEYVFFCYGIEQVDALADTFRAASQEMRNQRESED